MIYRQIAQSICNKGSIGSPLTVMHPLPDCGPANTPDGSGAAGLDVADGCRQIGIRADDPVGT
jgi:hypothetical protein